MMWNSFGDFLAMGGYGLYVWGSLGVCAVVCIAEPLTLVLKRRALLSEATEPDAPDRGESLL
ncbi:MAG: heme exporter protein CcmD [Polaromonas sp.]|nr:heme exporter protein CcmD [Polaromonas sp.]